MIVILLFTPLITNATEDEAVIIADINLINLTTEAQETDYVVKIGTTQYSITTLDELTDVTFALLKWEAKGSLDNKKITGTFNSNQYSGFDDVYAIVYELISQQL